MKRKKQSKITRSARGEICTIRIPGYCSHNNDQTVACHLGGGGMGYKQSDMFIAYGCYTCHQIVDGHMKCNLSKMEIEKYFYEAIFETQQKLLNKGLIQLNL